MKLRKSLAIATIGSAASLVALNATAVDTDNPFALTGLGNGYLQVAEGKCGEGKCGGHKKASGGKSISVLEGKCGEGKCGTVAIRQQMDKNRDGMINRQEYMDWATKMAATEFDTMDTNHDGNVDYDEFFEHFQEAE